MGMRHWSMMVVLKVNGAGDQGVKMMAVVGVLDGQGAVRRLVEL